MTFICVRGRNTKRYEVESVFDNREDALIWLEQWRELCEGDWDDTGYCPVIPYLPRMPLGQGTLIGGFKSGAEFYGVLEYE